MMNETLESGDDTFSNASASDFEYFDDAGAILVGVKCVFYPGSGFDKSCVSLFPTAFKIICIDTLPKLLDCGPNQRGFAKTCSPEVFFDTLSQNVGTPLNENGARDAIWTFKSHQTCSVIEYVHSTDANVADIPLECDTLYLRGFLPDSVWLRRQQHRHELKVFITCDTFLDDIDDCAWPLNWSYDVIHVCGCLSNGGECPFE
jgi:hypothetical protein